MSDQILKRSYFDWMYHLVCTSESYRRLLCALDSIDFRYELPMDANRFADGVDLRYIFGYENHIPNSKIAMVLDTRPCSVLEMMIALSRRCEDQIMHDPRIGNRTATWFREMIGSLGLGGMTDRHFDSEIVKLAIDSFLDHKYSKDGRGGLFTIPDTPYDLRNVEIWYQMNWYLDSIM